MSAAVSTEQSILDAAIDIFVEKGRHGAKMQEIADRAGINKALLHYYFRNKEKLYARVFERTFELFAGNLHTIFENNAPLKENIAEFIDRYIVFLQKNPRLPIFISRELSEGGKTARVIVEQMVREGRFMLPKVFVSKIEKAIERGEIRPLEPMQLVLSVIGSCVYFFIAEPLLNVFLVKDPDYDRDAFIKKRRQELYELIVYGIEVKNNENNGSLL